MFSVSFFKGALRCSLLLVFSLAGGSWSEETATAGNANSRAATAPLTIEEDSLTADSSALPELDTLKISTTRSVHTTSSITTIRSEHFLGKCVDLPAVLEQVSGVAIRRTGGFGEYSDASIRGSSPKQVQVYLDGIPLNSAAGGAVDLSKIPLTALQDVTVYKGTAPLELMGSAAGAVINLRSGSRKDAVIGLLELGSFGYRKAGTILRKKTGDMTHYFSVDYSGADNDYPYDDDNDTPYNSDDDAVKQKNHNEYSVIGVNYSNTWQILANHRLQSFVSFTDESQELFHKQLVNTTQLASYSFESALGRLDWEYTPSVNSIVETRFEGRYKRTLFDDPLGDMYLSGARKERNTFPFAALQCRASGRVNDYLGMQLLMRGGYEGYTTVNLLSPSSVPDHPAALRLSGGLAGECSLHRGNAGVTIRYNHLYVRDSANFTPNHGSGKALPKIWNNHFPNGNIDGFLNIHDWLTIDAAFRYEHLPVSLSDLYGWGKNYLGNPALLPERRFEGSIGCILRHNVIESSLNIFSGATIDVIELASLSQRVIRPINNGNTRQTGIEWDLHNTPWPFLTIDNHFTFIAKTRTRGSDEHPKEIPLLFFSPIENDFRVTATFSRFTLGHSVHYRSPFYSGYTKTTDLVAPAPACNISLSVTPVRQVTLTYRLENYLNVRYTPLSYYTPLPGRMHFFIGKIQW